MKISEMINFLNNNKIHFTYQGNLDFAISSFSTFDDYKDNSILWMKNTNKFDLDKLSRYKNLLIVTSPEFEAKLSKLFNNIVFVKNSKEVFFSLLTNFFVDTEKQSIDKTNSIIKSKDIGERLKIGFNCFIGEDVAIGDDVIIKNNVSIDSKVKIGKGTIIHSGVVIGTDGYGYFKNSLGKNIRVPHFG